MRQYQVPQFLTIEDKVIGPFTIKQAIYLGGGALLIVGARMFLKSYLFFPVTMFIGALAIALAFLKISDQPFPIVLKNSLLYLLRPRLYIWKREVTTRDIKGAEVKPPAGAPKEATSRPSESKLSELAWSLDIHERLRE